MSRAPGSYAGLTVLQADLLSLLRREQAAGRSPSFDEMTERLGLASKSGTSRLIGALVERGYIERIPNRARAVRVLGDPKPFRASVTPDDLEKFTIPQLIGELSARGLRVQVA